MMQDNQENNSSNLVGKLSRFAPGLPALLHYRFTDLPHDLIAGLSVAAVALPVGVAYAQLAGFEPVVGLYASILPLFVYALFGTSRQLILGPDAATCALIAAAIVPLAGGNTELYMTLSLMLTLFAGLFSIGASFLKLGALADFLSEPILVGFLNGISLHILIGQLGKILGFSMESSTIIPSVIEIIRKIDHIHWYTFGVGMGSFAVLLLSARLFPRLPSALVALVTAGAGVALLGLQNHGVAVIGSIPAGLPALSLPEIDLDYFDQIIGAAVGLALIGFSSMMLTARSFAAKNHYDIDADREFAALGAANIAAAFSHGFAISGADSRTAMSDSSGGRTQVTGLIAAATIAAVLLFLTEPLQFIPIAALGAILIKASISLLNIQSLKRFYRFDKVSLLLSLLATAGVIWVGAVEAILVAVILALVRFIQGSSRPKVELLGQVEGMHGLHSMERHKDASIDPGIILFRFNAPLVFFNAPYFKQQALAAIAKSGTGLKWFVLDALPLTQIDITAFGTLEEVANILKAQGAELVIAGRQAEFEEFRRSKGVVKEERFIQRFFPTLKQALRAYREMVQAEALTPNRPA